MLQHLKSTSSSEGELNTFKNVIVKINNHLNKYLKGKENALSKKKQTYICKYTKLRLSYSKLTSSIYALCLKAKNNHKQSLSLPHSVTCSQST